ncbi:MAG: hypothetical protein LBR08_02310 [Bacteroidales bacterium]|jgi:hypothetical protein|nr:hypothetical protein [Bacteroidales bacterium]
MKTVSFKSAAMLTAIALATVFSSCKKDKDGGNGDDAIFTPDKNLTQQQSSDLIAEATVATEWADEVYWVGVSKETQPNGTVTNYKYIDSYITSERKRLVMEYIVTGATSTLEYFSYTDGFIRYRYDTHSSPETKSKSNISDAYWDSMDEAGKAEYLESEKEWFAEFQWTVNGNELTGVRTESGTGEYNNYTETCTFVFTGSKKISSRKRTKAYTNGRKTESEDTFTYTAIFEIPSTLNISGFPVLEQKKVTIHWGAEAGNKTNIFWAEKSTWYDSGTGTTIESMAFYTPYATEEGPEIAGKQPEYYYDSGFTRPVENGRVTDISDDSTVLYVKWVAKTSGQSVTAAAKDKKPTLHRAGGK